MKKSEFAIVEQYMLQCMQQSVHDPAHIYRVLYAALGIVATEPAADKEVVMLAALLHDVGREEEVQNPSLHHATIGAGMAYDFLCSYGWSERIAAHVRDCILTHSYSAGGSPTSIEAKILYDADKLDLTGAVGCARAMLFGAEIGEPWYRLSAEGRPLPGKKGEEPSLFREYNKKLKKWRRSSIQKKPKKQQKRDKKPWIPILKP